MLVTGAAIAVALVVWLIRSQSDSCRELGQVDSFPPNSVSFEPCIPAFVVHGLGRDFTVFLAETPHLRGEPLRWNAKERLFVSPFHGEKFNLLGEPVAGPARRPLWRCPITVDSDQLLVDVPPGMPGSRIREHCRL
jgi:Rieske Fe-S protein